MWTFDALRRCREDDLWALAAEVDSVAWAMRYVKVPHPVRGLVPFIPWNYQADLARDSRRAILVNKGRQLGISTAICSMRIAHRVTHADGSTVLIVSRKGDTAAELMSMVTDAVKAAAEGDAGAPHISKENQMSLVFRGRPVDGVTQRFNSRVICETASPNAGRTYTATEVVLDEFAFMDYPREIWNSVWPTLSRGGTLIVVSTPAETPGTLFEQIWKNEELPFARYCLPWEVCPDYTPEWAERTRQEIGDRAFAQEYCCDFAAAGRPYFPGAAVDKCYAAHGNGPATIEAQPEPGHAYIVAADVAGGGEDYTVIGVWDVTDEPWRLVWADEFQRMDSREQQEYLDSLAAKWQGELVVDASGLGEMLLGQLRMPAVGIRIVGGYSWREDGPITSVAKEKLLAHALMCMEQGRVALPKMPRLDQELRQYVLPDHHVACDWVMMVAVALWRAGMKAGQAYEPQVVTMQDLFPMFRPVRASQERWGTDDLWTRGV